VKNATTCVISSHAQCPGTVNILSNIVYTDALYLVIVCKFPIFLLADSTRHPHTFIADQQISHADDGNGD
jgi:hypothetical protein